MMSKNEISHKGRIVSISGDRIQVAIVSESACGACRVAGLCSMSEARKKIVDVSAGSRTDWQVGQEVNVCLGRSTGMKAVFFFYVIPLLILMILIVSLSAIGFSDLAAGLTSLAGVALYYLVIYWVRDRFAGTCEFYIKEI